MNKHDEPLNTKDLWKVALAQIEVKLDSSTQFRTWFTDTKLEDLTKGKAVIAVKNHYAADWLRRKHQPVIESTLAYLCGEKVKVEYRISENFSNQQIPTIKDKEESKSTQNHSIFGGGSDRSVELENSLQRSHINTKYSFENFVVGDSNKMAHAAAIAVANNPGGAYNPMFIYGHTGLGKTHLAHATARRILEKDPDKRITYVAAETFMNQMVKAIRGGNNFKFREKYRDNTDLLVIDDIQFISSWEKTQTEFFNTFNILQAAGRQIIIISDRSPDELKELTPRLRSRFQGGIVVDVSRPEYEHRLAILEKKLNSLGAKVARHIIEYIAKNITDNIRELEGALQKIALIASLVPSGELTVEDVAKQLGKDAAAKRKKVSVNDVLKKVAKDFEIKVSDIKGNRRTKDIAIARQVCMYILREELNYKLEEIAKLLNRKDHTTIMHGIDRVKSLRLSEDVFRDQLVSIIETLNSEV